MFNKTISLDPPQKAWLDLFIEQCTPSSFALACHAALPLFFRVDWLYHLWANFGKKIAQKAAFADIASIVYAPFTQKIGTQMYEFDNQIRNYLLGELEKNYGEAHLQKLAAFLYQYAEKQSEKGEKDTHQVTAWLVFNPQQAAQKIGELLGKALEDSEQEGEQLRLYFVMENLTQGLEAQNKQPFEALQSIAEIRKDQITDENPEKIYRKPVFSRHEIKNRNSIALSIPNFTETNFEEENSAQGIKGQQQEAQQSMQIPAPIRKPKEVFNLIDQLNFAEAFGEIDKHTLKSAQYLVYNGLKNEYILGKKNDPDFIDRLKTFVGTIDWKIKPENLLERFFKKPKKISEITKADLLDLRSDFYVEKYFRRPFDDLLDERIAKHKSVVLVGNPLSGKSTALYESLINIPNEKAKKMRVLFPKLEINYAFDTILQFDDFSFANYIVLINNLHDYAKEANFGFLLKTLLNRGALLLASCRKGEEYAHFETMCQSVPQIREALFEITIPIIEDERENIQNQLEKVIPYQIDGFDGNIGSWYLPLVAMRQKYEKLQKQATENDPIARTSIWILHCLKLFYHMEGYTERMSYPFDKVIEFTHRYVSHYELEKPTAELSFEEQLKLLQTQGLGWAQNQTKKSSKIVFEKHFEKALKHLRNESHEGLSFVRINETQNLIKIEQVYLDKIIELDFTAQKAKNELFEVCDENKQRYFGLYGRIAQRNMELHHADFAQALEKYQKAKKQGEALDEISYNTLINKSDKFEDAKFFFEEMKKANLRPNEISYNTLINKSQTFEQQKPYYQEFIQKFPLRKGNFKSEKNYNFLFTALFKKIKNKTDWDFIKTEIYRLGFKMNDYTQKFYDTLSGRYL